MQKWMALFVRSHTTSYWYWFSIILYCFHQRWYGDGAGNIIAENSSVFSLIRMR